MTYGPQHGTGPRLEVFSDPQSLCTGAQGQARPCGVEGEEVNGADAVTSLNATRFQIARLRESKPDADGDGFVDPGDDLPSDAGEWRDTDGDGIGNNQDTDDDGDGVGDDEDIFPLDATESADTDKDGVGNNADSDADSDGVLDGLDLFPQDAARWTISSYVFVGENQGDLAGEILAAGGDGDQQRLIIGVPHHDIDELTNAGAVYLVAASDLAALDAADGLTDRAIGLGHVTSGANSWKIVGGDGKAELLIGAWRHRPGDGTENLTGAVYWISSSDFHTADPADGMEDGVVNLGNISGGSTSWKLVDGTPNSAVGNTLAAVDVDGDGNTEIVAGAPEHPAVNLDGERGAIYVVAASDLASADAADGETDRVAALGHVTRQPNSWKLVGGQFNGWVNQPKAVAGRTDDSAGWLVAGGYVVSATDLAPADAADGNADGAVEMSRLILEPDSWRVLARNVGVVGDMDGDGRTDHLMGNPQHSLRDSRGAIHLLLTADISGLDRADGLADRRMMLENLAGDTDGDGTTNTFDRDDDDDGFEDDLDGFPLDPAEWADTDGDGIAEYNSNNVASDGDGNAELVVGAPAHDTNQLNEGAVYLISGEDLPSADSADGTEDGKVELARIAAEPNSWKLESRASRAYFGRAISAGDVNGDGQQDLVLFNKESLEHSVGRVLPWNDERLAEMDEVDGTVDGVISLENTTGTAGSFTTPPILRYDPAYEMTDLADFDGDGLGDIVLEVVPSGKGRFYRAAYLINAADLPHLDAADGNRDGRIFLTSMVRPRR